MESERLFAEAQSLMPGGVSSPVRAIRPYPFYTERANGARLHTVDGADLVDCCMAYGPLILGHAHPSVKSAIECQLAKGWLYGTPTPGELELARLILADHPACERIRFVSTGAEATMAAIRAARGFTEKQAIVKVEGGFHGAHDAVLIKAGSGATTMGVPDSAGVPPAVAAMTLQVPYNDPEALDALLARREDVAAMIVEPVMGNVGLVLPEDNYLAEARRITEEHGVLLIFDEVITGYRIGIGGAQRLYRIRPDLTTFGKVIGGGLPIGAFAGRREIMQLVAPAGPVYQAGTYSGNPLSLAAGAAAIGYLHAHPACYRQMEEQVRAIGDAADGRGTGSFVQLGSCFTYFFRSAPPRNYVEAKESDTSAFRAFWEGMLARGIFLPPSQFETCFLSAAHTPSDVERISRGFQTCL